MEQFRIIEYHQENILRYCIIQRKILWLWWAIECDYGVRHFDTSAEAIKYLHLNFTPMKAKISHYLEL